MAQKVTGYIKLQIPAGKATPAPPVGPALGQHGVNIMAFTKEFNERTQKDMGYIIPVVITVYQDRSFTFITKTPPAPVLIKKACGIEHASGRPNRDKVANITKAQVKEIAELNETLSSRRRIQNIIVAELRRVIKQYPSPRRSGIVYAGELPEEEPD